MNVPKYFYHAMAFLWLWSGVQPIVFSTETSLTMLAQVGFSVAWQYPVLLVASLLDCAFALGCMTQFRHKSLFWLAQFITVAVYSLIIAFRLPEMWAHPFAPLIKNLPILAILYFLFQQNKQNGVIS